MKKLLFLFILFFMLTGCSDYKELNNIAIISSISIDKNGDNYIIGALVANSRNPAESNTEATAGNAVYEVESNSIAGALQKLDSILPKKIYLGHLGVVIISEDVAKEGVINITDYFFRNPETTKRFYLIMTEGKDKASDVLKMLSPLESFPFQNIRLNIENASSSGALSHNLTFSKFLEMYLKKGSDPFLPTIEIVGDIKKGSSTKSLESSDISFYIKLKGIAIFKDDKFITYANIDESRGINLAIGNVNDAVINTKLNDKDVIVNVSNIKTKKKVKLDKHPIYYIEVKGTGDIEEIDSGTNLYNNKNINIIKKKTEQEIKNLITKGINKAFRYKSDPLEFGNMLYKKNPKFYNSIDNWNDYLNKLEINIDVDINIQNKGSIKQTIKAAKK